MDEDQGLRTDAESYVFLNEGDARSVKSDSSDVNSVDSGVPLSEVESALAEKVRHLKQENKEIRSAIDNYEEALKLCQDNLNNIMAQQGEIQSNTLQKYDQAKVKVQRQNETIFRLEKQLQEEKNKLSELRQTTKIETDKQQSEKKDNEKVDISERKSLEDNVHNTCQFINTLSTLTPDECKTSMSPNLLQDLVHLSAAMNSIRPLIISEPTIPDNDHALAEELKNVKEQLKQEEEKRAKVENENNKLKELVESKRKERVDGTEIQELLNRDVEQTEIRAGSVLRDSQTTEESFNLKEQQSVDDSLKSEIEKLKTNIRELEKRNAGQKKIMNEREIRFNREKDKSLDEKEIAKNRVLELETEVQDLKAKLNEKDDDTRLAETEEAKNKLQQELLQQKVQYDALQKELQDTIGDNETLEAKLNENNLHFLQEVKMKEGIENELKAQVYSFYQDLQAKEQECQDWKARLEIADTEFHKMNSALEEMRKELDTAYSENEKLLTDRKAVNGAELGECKSIIDNLTAQLFSAEEMLENKEQDLQNAVGKLETHDLLKQQCDLFKADFNQEKQTREKVEADNKKLRDEVERLRTDNERLRDEASDPTGSKMADMQRRHGMHVGNESNNPWGGFYDQFLAPRGMVPGARPNAQPGPPDTDINRQVSGGRCPKCDRMFPDLDRLQTHVVECLESESTGSVGGVICPKCQDSFPDLDTLQIHVMECLDN